MSKAVFITGTGTDMGKTYLSGLIVKKLAQAGKNPASIVNRYCSVKGTTGIGILINAPAAINAVKSPQ